MYKQESGRSVQVIASERNAGKTCKNLVNYQKGRVKSLKKPKLSREFNRVKGEDNGTILQNLQAVEI